MAFLNWASHDINFEKDYKAGFGRSDHQSRLGENVASSNSFGCQHGQMDISSLIGNYEWHSKAISGPIEIIIKINCKTC